MNRTNELVDMMFRDIPYSDEIMKAQAEIKEALRREYEKLALHDGKNISEENTEKSTAFDRLIVQYGSLYSMAALAGYTGEDVDRWREAGEAGELKPLKKEIARQKRRIYGISILTVFTLVEILEAFALHWFNSIFAIIYGTIGFAIWKKYRKAEKEYETEKFDVDAYSYLRKLSDRYAKRRLNGIALLFAVFTIFIMSELSFYFFGNSKAAELKENFFSNIIIAELPIYICIKNYLCFSLIHKRIALKGEKNYKKHRMGILLFSVVFWLTTVSLVVILKNTVQYPANLFMMAGILFMFLMILYNFLLRKKITCQNIVFNKRRFISFGLIIVIAAGYLTFQRDTWYTQTYINSVPLVEHSVHDITYNDDNGVYTITSSTEDFKILHLTDIQLGASVYSYSKDIKALKACFAELAYTKPDLVIVTGDLSFPLGIMSMSFNNSAPVGQFAAFMRNTGIPWAFTYGNHDTESLASTNKSELNEIYKSLSFKTSGTLLYPYTQPDITGRNNQLIEVRNSDGTLMQALFLIDSNACTGEGINVYDYIHDDQVAWYEREVKRLNEEEGRIIPSMAFFHIPLQQYRTAYELYTAGSDEVTYFFGENGEKMINKVCCSDYPSSLFDKMLQLGSTKGVFCGHDHYNNMSLEYKGIRLTYGMSIDYLAMPGIEHDTKQRGAELITVHRDGTWDLVQIPLTDIVN